MKKRWLLLLLVPLLAITMISCDPEMRGTLASTMDKFGTNVYLESGLVEANLADAQAASNTIAALGSGESSEVTADDLDDDGDLKIFTGVKVDPPTSNKMLKPQEKEDQTKLKNNLADAFNSTQQKEELKKKMSEKITDEDQKEAVKGSVEVLNKAIENLVGDGAKDPALKDAVEKLKLPKITDDDELTAGDLLLVQMMTNLISNTLTTFSEMPEDEDDGLALLLPIIDDALFTAQVAEELSGAASIDFTGQLDLMSLLSDLDGDDDKGARKALFSRDGTEDDDEGDGIPEEFRGIIESLGTDIIDLMGLKKGDGEYDWAAGGYRSFIANQYAYRGSLEYALTMAEKAKHDIAGTSEIFDSSTAIKYLLAVIFTEADTWGTDGTATVGDDAEQAGRYLLRTLMWAILEDPDMFDDDDAFEVDVDDFGEFIVDKGEDEVREIFENTLKINQIGGIDMLSDLIDDFLNTKGDDGKTEFDKFWANLTESDSDN